MLAIRPRQSCGVKEAAKPRDNLHRKIRDNRLGQSSETPLLLAAKKFATGDKFLRREP
jgi:hypothetical protein